LRSGSIFKPQKREIILGGSDLVDFGVGKQVAENRRRRLAIITGMTGIGKNRFGSIGDWPCFAVTIMSVESEQAVALQVRNHFADGDIHKLDLLQQELVGVPIAS